MAEVHPDRIDSILALALGAQSGAREFDAWIERATRAEAAPALADDDPALLAVLGLISLRRTTRRWLDEAALDPAVTEATAALETTAPDDARTHPPRTGWLR